jgi:hypothetical protein
MELLPNYININHLKIDFMELFFNDILSNDSICPFLESDDPNCPISKNCDVQYLLKNDHITSKEIGYDRLLDMVLYLEVSLGYKRNEGETLAIPDKKCLYESKIKIPEGKVIWKNDVATLNKEIFLFTDKDGRNPTFSDGTPCPLKWTEDAIRQYVVRKNI